MSNKFDVQKELVSTYQEIYNIVSNIKNEDDVKILEALIYKYQNNLQTLKQLEAKESLPGYFLYTFSTYLYEFLVVTKEKNLSVPEEITQLLVIINKIKDIVNKKNELEYYLINQSRNIKNNDVQIQLKNKVDSLYNEMNSLENMIKQNIVSGFNIKNDFLNNLQSLIDTHKTIYTTEKLLQSQTYNEGLQQMIDNLLKTSFLLPETRSIINGYVPDKNGNIPNENKFFIPIIYRPGGVPELTSSVYNQIVEIKYAINIGRLRKILDDDTQYSVFLNALKQYPSCNFDSMVFNTEDQKCMKLLIDSFMNIINESNYSVQKKNEIITFLSKGKLEAEKIIKQRGTSVMYRFTKTASKNKTRKRSSNIPKSLENKPKKCKVVLQSGRRSGKECGRDIPCLYHDEPEENETNNQSGGKKKKTIKKHKKKSGKKKKGKKKKGKKTIKKHKKKSGKKKH
jgi:hypothetical protein